MTFEENGIRYLQATTTYKFFTFGCCILLHIYLTGDTCISDIGNTPTMKKRQAITGVRQKASIAHSLITMTLKD
jgi:hypothetical protein